MNSLQNFISIAWTRDLSLFITHVSLTCWCSHCLTEHKLPHIPSELIGHSFSYCATHSTKFCYEYFVTYAVVEFKDNVIYKMFEVTYLFQAVIYYARIGSCCVLDISQLYSLEVRCKISIPLCRLSAKVARTARSWPKIRALAVGVLA